MKIKLQRLILCIIVCITMLNLTTSLISSTVSTVQATTVVNEVDENSADDSMLDTVLSFFGTAADGLIGIISKVVQLPFLLIGMGFQGLVANVARLGGSKIQGFLTPDDIIFNRVGLTDINFFNFSGGQTVVDTIRQNIATWYYILRVLSTVILLAVLIYVGIRMAISTVASEQAQYKRMLKDWAVSFALLFLLNYIIMFTIEVNNALIEMLSGPARVTIGDGVMGKLATMVVAARATTSWAAFIVYFGLIGMTTAFLLMYIKRMLTIGFLIIISPLITITYSIDKIKDGKAQALNAWMKEFMVTVLIQPFHCIIYLAFVSTILDTIGSKASLTTMILAVVCMKFMWTAEKIVKEIFGLQDKSGIGDAIAAVATVKAVSTTVGKTIGKTASNTRSGGTRTVFGQNIMNRPSVQRLTTAMNNFSNTRVGGAVKTVAKPVTAIGKFGTPIAMGVMAGSFEMGANTSANAAHVGAEVYSQVHKMINEDEAARDLRLSKAELSRSASMISNGNTFRFGNYTTNQTNMNNLRAYAQSLIGTNMQHLENDIQTALGALITNDPATYNTTTAAGIQHLKDLQDMALNPNLDFNDPATNPLGHAWTTEERQVVTAIQTRNFARDVNRLYSQFQTTGSNNPAQNVDDYINSLSH